MKPWKVYQRGDLHQIGIKGWFFYTWWADNPMDMYFGVATKFSDPVSAKVQADRMNRFILDRWKEV